MSIFNNFDILIYIKETDFFLDVLFVFICDNISYEIAWIFNQVLDCGNIIPKTLQNLISQIVSKWFAENI